MVIATTVGVFKRSVSILMERVPYGMDSEEIKEAICDIPGILEVKSLNVWSLTVGQVALAGSVYVQPEIKDLKKAAAIVTKARKMLKNRYGIRECTIQVEIYTPNAESSHQRRSDSATILSSVSTASTRVSMHGGKGIGESRHSIDALARHDKDIIFSIGEDELEETLSPRPTRSSSGHLHTPHLIPNEIIRAGTPLSQYRENRHMSEDDESESEMDQETHLRSKPSHWV
ncbi:hypothetical protein BGX20_008445 [Mortierella sp. AD010]|nr:hypothetical protein BGX20_008445 [Mortierella sp. AD010]